MAKKVLLLHGWGGSDFPHWQSWLAGELARDYGCVNFLRFSDFDTPKRDLWMQELLHALEDFRPDIVICHSLANTLWMYLCQTQQIKEIQKLYLVAPPSLHCQVQELQEFFPQQVPSTLNVADALLICSDNDPYMSVTEATELQAALKIDMKMLKNAGHINADSGYGQWPWMLQELKKELSS